MGGGASQPNPQDEPLEASKRLLCTECGKPLSRFPIYAHAIRGYCICGRCTATTDLTDFIHNWAYEQLASTNKFACCYQPNGCTQLLLPEEVENHEKYCSFQKYKCPFGLQVCPWQGFYKQHLDHFKENHSGCILNGKDVEVDFNDSCKDIYLITCGEDVFFVTKEIDSRFKTFSCSVQYIERSLEVVDFHYAIEFSGSDIKRRFRTLEHIFETYEVKESVLRENLRNPGTISFRMEIINGKEKESITVDVKSNNTEIKTNKEEQYTCPVCMEHFLPPIYICDKGHSICIKCRHNVPTCPMCRAPYDMGARNYTLENIVLAKPIPCKYLNCTFSGRGIDSIMKHQNVCLHRVIKCPLKCEKSLQFNEINDHVEITHKESILEPNVRDGFFELEYKNDCIYVLKYGSRLFIFVMDETAYTLQLIGSSDDCKHFLFEMQFRNAEGHKICVEGPCVQLKDNDVVVSTNSRGGYYNANRRGAWCGTTLRGNRRGGTRGEINYLTRRLLLNANGDLKFKLQILHV